MGVAVPAQDVTACEHANACESRLRKADDYLASLEPRRRRRRACLTPRSIAAGRARRASMADADRRRRRRPVALRRRRTPITKRRRRAAMHIELALARAAVARGCRCSRSAAALQVLNVALGGTLVQDIPSRTLTTRLDHRVTLPKDRLAHIVDSPGSRSSALVAVADDGGHRGQQPPPSGGEGSPGLVAAATAPEAWSHRSRRATRSPLLRRRAVASGELLAHRRDSVAVREFCQRCPARLEPLISRRIA